MRCRALALLVVVAATAVARAEVLGVRFASDRCLDVVDVDVLLADVRVVARTLVVVVHEPDASERELVRALAATVGAVERRIEVLVALECARGRLALFFAGMELTETCAAARVVALMAAVDAPRPADSFTVKARHVLRELDAWLEARHCVRWSQERANALGLLLLVLLVGCSWRRRPPP